MNCRLGFNKLLRSMHNDYKTCYGNVRYYHDYKEPTACSNVEPEKVHILTNSNTGNTQYFAG